MSIAATSSQMEHFTTFGALLKYFRRRAGLSQLELSIAVGYSGAQISRIEHNQRLPDLAYVLARFVPALGLEGEPAAIARLVALAAQDVPMPTAATSPARPKHNLPLQSTRFFGREVEAAQLKERLAEQQLVTLSGPGGVGKTRLALRVAEEVLVDFEDGAWFVELAPLSNPALVIQQVATVLGVHDQPGRPTLETLAASLRNREALLVLDNCEHLLDACAHLTDALLRGCPRLRLLVTSRAALGVAGEAVYPVPSLPVPDPNQLPPIPALLQNVALRLFVDRAGQVLPNYKLESDSAAAIVWICRRLDGIPLAIEMAAARMNLLSAQQLAERLDNAFHLLTGGNRTALPRQQSLRATLDWSYKLLNHQERLLLQRLSVFAGGASLEAIEAVCADVPAEDEGKSKEGSQLSSLAIPPASVLELLGSLVAKSMVIAARGLDGIGRCHLLEVVGQFAREKLYDTGNGVRLRTAHRNYFASFARLTVKDKYTTAAHSFMARQLENERDNLRLALEWSLSELGASDVAAGPRLVVDLLGLWPTHQENLDWLRRGLAWCQSHGDIPPELYVELLSVGSGPISRNDPKMGLQLAQQAVEESRALGPAGAKILILSLLTLCEHYAQGVVEVDQGLDPLAEAEALYKAVGRDHFPGDDFHLMEAWIGGVRAALEIAGGRYGEALASALESLRICEKFGRGASGLDVLLLLGRACFHLNEHTQARDYLHEALSLTDEFAEDLHGNKKSYCLRWLAQVDLQQGDIDQAQQYLCQSLRLALRVVDYNIVASGLGLSAIIFAQQDQPLPAAQLSGAAHTTYTRQQRMAWEDSSLDTMLPGWRESSQSADIQAAYEAGRAMSVERAVALALGQEGS